MSASPRPAAQRKVLKLLAQQLHPLVVSHKLPVPFLLQPGLRLRRRYVLCCHFRDGRPPLISVRCVADGDQLRWRRRGAIVGTLAHELAHLRHHGHSEAFWRLCRRLLDDAAGLGIYDAGDDDPNEPAQGRLKLAGSAAEHIVQATRLARRERSTAARAVMSRWPVGAWGRIRLRRGAVRTEEVKVLSQRRTRLLVGARDGRRYLVLAAALEPLDSDVRL